MNEAIRQVTHVQNIRYDKAEERLYIIDQTLLPNEEKEIELRDGDEIKNLWYEKPMALPEVKCFNPSFDVTDHELLTGIVTEKGICYPPFTESLAALFKDKK